MKVKDYRPVSILPALSNVFERLLLSQLVLFIDEFAPLAPRISGFRKGHSTISVLLGIRDDVLRAMKRGEVTLVVFADFSKALATPFNSQMFLRKCTPRVSLKPFSPGR